MLEYLYALVAQGIEHSSPKAGVVRSNRIEGTILFAEIALESSQCRIIPITAQGFVYIRLTAEVFENTLLPCVLFAEPLLILCGSIVVGRCCYLDLCQ